MAFTSLNSSLQPTLVKPYYSLIQFQTPTGSTYSGAWRQLRHSILERITLRVGPDPSEAVFQVPVDVVAALQFQRTFFSNVTSNLFRGNLLSPFTTTMPNFEMMTKVRIFGGQGITPWSVVNSVMPSFPIFVGYVTDIEYVSLGQEGTTCRVTCKDVRELLRKTPFYGYLFENVVSLNPPGGNDSTDFGETVYIRDRDVIFNEGMQPNMFYSPVSTEKSQVRPRFIRDNHSRFIDDDDSVDHKLYIHDAWTEDVARKDKIGVPYAAKWKPGNVWNYIVNIIDSFWMQGSSRLYTIPANSLSSEELPPLRDSEVNIARMYPGQSDGHMFSDWFNPRAVIGATSQTGFGTAVSAIGEFNPTGMPINELLFRLCRMVGNYTYTVYFDSSSRAILVPFRTVQGIGENSGLKVGLEGGSNSSGGGKVLQILTPTAVEFDKPDVPAMKLKASSESYFNDFLMKGGPREVTSTFMTMGKDNSTDRHSRVHRRYDFAPGGVPADQPIPALDLPTLEPGWSLGDETSFVTNWLIDDTTEHWPSVFVDWLVPQEGLFTIDWVKFFGRTIGDDEPGFRRFLDRDRPLLDQLSISIFETALGLFRRRRKKLPITVSRLFRGIRTDSDGNTAYGDQATTEGNDPEGFDDWFPVLFGVELLTDGRLGFRLHPEARLNRNYKFENHATGAPAGSGASSSPGVWNGLDTPNTRTYELMITMNMELDEDLAEKIIVPNSGSRRITQYGPRLEMYRNAGQHYKQEHAVHTMIPRFGAGTGSAKYHAIPPVDGTGQKDDDPRIFRDDRAEMLARTRMMANRHAKIDIEGQLHLAHMNLGLWAGNYIDRLRDTGSGDIKVGAIISSLTHDWQTQKTSVELATIR